MGNVQYWAETSAMSALRPLVGLWRHDPIACKPGTYRVVFCDCGSFAGHHNAVMDDFGNLVKVP